MVVIEQDVVVAEPAELELSWQPTNFRLSILGSQVMCTKSCAQSHALSRGQSPDQLHKISRDTSHNLWTQHWSHDMMSQSRRF